MPKILIARRGPPVQVDDFPETEAAGGGKRRPFERSCEGALHLRPGSVEHITDDELHHIIASGKHSALAGRIQELPSDKPKAVTSPAKAKPSPAKFDDGKSTKPKKAAPSTPKNS